MTLLQKAELWLSELGIRVKAQATCLAVNRDDVENLGGNDELLKELRLALESNRYNWQNEDANNYYLSDFI